MHQRRYQTAGGDVIGRIAAQHRCQMRHAKPRVVALKEVLRALKLKQIDRVTKLPVCCFRLLALHGFGAPGSTGADVTDGEGRQGKQGSQRDDRGSGEDESVFSNQLLETIERARRTGDDRLMVQVSLHVCRQTISRLISARAVFLQALHHDPIQVLVDCGLRIADCGFP